MNQLTSYLILITLIALTSCKKEDTTNPIEEPLYENNENETFQDFLTPNYYNANENNLRDAIDNLIHFARLEDYQHPFQNPNGIIAPYTMKRSFGTGIGMGGTSQHHPAIDLHPDNTSSIAMYAAHEGLINTYIDSPKYRNYLTVTKEIKDSENRSIGKLVSLYAHIDLDLDENQSLLLNGIYVNKGDLISENLHSGTKGGPHLHFEIRFYKNSEIGNEDFYNWQNTGNYTTQSAGIWSYGYWNPTIGYGFGNPQNFGIE